MANDPKALRRLAARTLMPGFVGTSVPTWIEREYAAGLGSVCLFGTNFVDAQQLARLCTQLRSVGPALLVAIDEEGGDVTRLHCHTGSPQPGNGLLGRLDDTDLTRACAVAIGRELAAHGINLDLAPDVDVNSADENPVIGVRSFGADPALVARHSRAYVEGLQSTGVAACAKHFPGHGDTVTDSHLALPRVDVSRDVLEARELVPFAAAIAAGAASIMTSHIVVSAIDPTAPATFSAPVVQGVLREQLGFDGVVVTDALDMAGASADTGIPEAAVRALLAGCDLLCLGSETTEEGYLAVVAAVVAAVSSGRLDRGRLEEAAARVDRLADAFPVVVPAGSPTPAASPFDGTPAPLSKPLTDPSTGVPLDPSTDPLADPLAAVHLERGFALSAAVPGWLAADGRPVAVQVASASNLAVGPVRWGPAAAGLTTQQKDVRPGDNVAVVGRGLGPRHPAWALARDFRDAGHPTVVVECGWPRGGADVVTFGGSLAVGQALGRLLGLAPA